MSENALVQLLSSGSSLVILATIIVTGLKEWWVTGAAHRRMEAAWSARFDKMESERDKWQNMALRLLDATEALADR